MDFEARKKKKERTILLSIVICVILMIATLFGIVYFTQADNAKFKVFVDDKQAKITSNFLLEQDGVRYVSIEELATLLGYTYSGGNEKDANEVNECYIENAYIRTNFTNNSNKFQKLLLSETFDVTVAMNNPTAVKTNSANAKKEIYTIESNVIMHNNKLYVPLKSINRAFDISVNNNEAQRLRIYNLNYLYPALLQDKNYAGYNIATNYSVARSLADGLMIYNTQGKWGVLDVYTSPAKKVLNPTYDSIEYCANINKFIVNSLGEFALYDLSGAAITKQDSYDSLEIMDQELELFLMQKDNQYGVINGNGEVVVFPEYDKIGIDDPTMYQNVEIPNSRILLGNMIPVYKNRKWGAFDVKGNAILPVSYSTLGYNLIRSASSGNVLNGSNDEKNLLIIPESAGVEGIVIGQEFSGTVSYGVINKYGTFLIPCGCEKIFYKREGGKDTYLINYMGQELNYTNYVKANQTVLDNANFNAFEGKVGDGMSQPVVETQTLNGGNTTETNANTTTTEQQTNTAVDTNTTTTTDTNTVENEVVTN